MDALLLCKELALRLEPLIRTKAKGNLKTHTEQGYQNSGKAVSTDKELAKIAGVSHDTIYKVRKINNEATEEIKQKVKSGEMSLKKGYDYYSYPLKSVQKINCVQNLS